MEKIPEKWIKLFDNTVRKEDRSNRNPLLVFDHNEMIIEEYGRKVFRQDPNKVFLTIGHPLMQRAITIMKKQLWQTSDYKELTKWLITENSENDNLLIVNILYTIRNGLSENFHSELLSLKFLINFNEKKLVDAYRDNNMKKQNIQGDIEIDKIRNNSKLVKPLRTLWIRIEKDLKNYLNEYSEERMNSFTNALPNILSRELSEEETNYETRINELKTRRSKREKTKLSKLLDKEQEALESMHSNLEFYFARELFEQNLILKKAKIEKIEQRIEEFELASYINYIKSVENLIEEEHKEMMDEILPNRYKVKASEFHPVSLEFSLSKSKISELEEMSL